MNNQAIKSALITGAAQRVGAEIARKLHSTGYNILLHYRNSHQQAETLMQSLHAQRPGSVIMQQADLHDTEHLAKLVETINQQWGRLDALINNASSFYPTPIGQIREQDWSELMGSNLKAPLFLSQAATELLSKTQGAIINIIDIHAERPMRKHTVYSIAKAGLSALTKSLARELAPNIRVNGIAPGAILWPEDDMPTEIKDRIIERIALHKTGDPNDIAETVAFLLNSPYITGQIIAVDGGRSLYM